MFVFTLVDCLADVISVYFRNYCYYSQLIFHLNFLLTTIGFKIVFPEVFENIKIIQSVS